jgi:hypothetical protein
MDVLNTTGGGVDGWAIVGAILSCLVAVIYGWVAVTACKERDWAWAIGGTLMALCFSIMTFGCSFGSQPIRHEVTLRPGHVIDATKYEIVEQRGKIYVIEEREAGE